MKSETRATEIEVYPITRSSQITRLRFERTGIGIRMVMEEEDECGETEKEKMTFNFLCLLIFSFFLSHAKASERCWHVFS
jgi:hypothetical protein